MVTAPTTSSLDALPCGFIQLDASDRVVEWNQRLERWTGRSRAETTGHSLIEIFPENPALANLLAEVRANRRPRVLAQMFHRRLIPVPLPPGHLSGLAEMQQECHLVPLESPAGHLAISIVDVTPHVVGQQRTQAMVVERNLAEEAVRRRAEFLAALNHTTLEMMGRRNVTELLQALAERAGTLLNSPHVEVALLEGEELVVRAFSRSCDYLVGDCVRRGEAPLDWQAVDSRVPVVVACYSEHPACRPIYRPHQLQAAANIPIIRGAECVGVLGIARTQPGLPYTDEEIQQGVLLARMAALVVHNASTYEEAVRENEEKFRGVFDQSPIIIALVSVPDSRIVELNSAALAAFGYTRDEVLGKTPAELGLWVDLPLREVYLEKLRAAGSVTGFESQMRRKNGETFTVLNSGCIVSLGGQPFNIVSLQDITLRKQSEAARDRSLALIRATLESAADGILVVNADGHIATYNQVFAELWQIEYHETVDRGQEERLLQRILQQLVVPEDFLVSVRDVYARSADEVFDVLRCKDGRVFERYSRPQLVADQPAGRVWSFRDTTEQRQAEAALRESEERFRVLADVSPVGIFSSDPQGRTTFVNRRWCEIAGMSAAQAMGDGWRTALHPDDVDRVLAAWNAAVQTGESVATEFRFVRPDGSVTWLVGQSRVQTRPDGSRAGYVGTITDVTSLKHAEEEQRKAEAHLRHAQKMETLGTLAGGIAHDFNNILTGTFGFVDLARLELPEAHRAHAWLDRISASSQRARDLVRQILTFSRKQEGKRSPQRLHIVVAEALRLLQSTIPPIIELEARISPEAPAVLADATQIHQIVVNLCTNAWHAMPPGGGRITVTLEAWTVDAAQAANHPELHPGPHVRLAVTDNGSGMDAQTLEHIFEPFFTTKATGSGTGLGLAVVHGIVKLHTGAITVRSAVGTGTTFELFFPAFDGDVTAVPFASAQIPRGAGERVMLVDDDAVSGFAIEKLIETLNYSVKRFNRPEEALATFATAPEVWDLVVSDLAMPGMNGDELVGRMLRIRPDLPVVIVTGFIETARQQLLEKTHARAVLHKPVVRHELARALASHVRRPSLPAT